MVKRRRKIDIAICKAEKAWEDAEKQARAARRELKKLLLERVEMDYGVKIGCIVSTVRRRIGEPDKEQRFKVGKIDVTYGGSPVLEGYLIKKDGTPSKRLFFIGYEWEVEK